MQMKYISKIAATITLGLIMNNLQLDLSASGQNSAKAPVSALPGLSLRVFTTPGKAETFRDPQAAAWGRFPVQRAALNRTPRLYDTEPPSEPEIPFVDIRLVRTDGKLLVQMVWRDPTQDSAQIASLPSTPAEGRSRKELTEATDRFFDAAAVMHPAQLPPNGVWPSLQMGESGVAVRIYFWNAARGAVLMEAEGRGTTRRTNEAFPAQAAYKEGAWHLTMELPDKPSGMPLAFAIWNGRQQDRDGRKYFTTWLRLD
jgi:hypothetical protein